MQVPLSLNHLLERAGRLFPTSEIVSRLPDKSYRRHSYAVFYQRARQLAQALLSLGLQPGERVATLCWNHHAHLECYFGIPAAGGVMHTLNLRLSPDEIAWIANDAQDRILVVDDVLLPLYRQVASKYQFEKVIVFAFSGATVDASLIDYESLLAQSEPSRFDYASHHEDDAVSMCYTSGTTGRPKGWFTRTDQPSCIPWSPVWVTSGACAAPTWSCQSRQCSMPTVGAYRTVQ